MSKVDNYIKYLNAFYEWEQRYYLSPIQQCILMRILHRINKAGWCEWIKIANSELINELRISSPKTFIDNRNRLMELGLIQYKAGKKGKPSNYKLNMPQKKEIIYSYSFGKKENDEKKGIPNIPKSISNNIPKNDKNEKKGILNIPKSISKSISKSILNNPETPHEQCVPNTPKHKTINNNSIIRNINITHNTLIAESEKISHEQMNNDIVSLFNKICLNLPKVSKLSKKRTQLLTKLFKAGYTQQEFKQVFEMANNSDFLCGKTANSTFRANFDWILNENNFIKVLEGNYANFDNQNLSDGINQERKPSYDIDEYRRFCQNTLMRSRSTDGFSEALKEELSRPEHIEVEVT